MLKQTKRIALRNFSFSSKLEPERDHHTGSGQNVPAPAPQHYNKMLLYNFFFLYFRLELTLRQTPVWNY